MAGGAAMKRMMVICFMVAMIAMSVSGVQAIVANPSYYEMTLPFGDTLSGPGAFATGAFTGIPGAFSSALIELTFANVGPYQSTVTVPGTSISISYTTSPFAYANAGNNLLFSFVPQNGTMQFSLSAVQLNALNASISQGTLPATLILGGGTVRLDSAKLSGNVAPEPVTMALMGAGLAGLPVVRRLRRNRADI